MSSTRVTELLTAAQSLSLFSSWLLARRARLRRPVRVAFAVIDEGPFLLDLSRTEPLQRGWRKDADVSVLCNRRTLSDLVHGAFEYRAPQPGQLFVWGGDREVWAVLAEALSNGLRVTPERPSPSAAVRPQESRP